MGLSRTVSEIVEKRKIIPPRVFNAPAEGVPVGIGYRRKDAKTRMIGLLDGRKRFKIGLAV